jgi:hypothetical protein
MLISKFWMQMPKLPTAPTLARLLVLLFILLWTAAALSYVYRGVLDSISRDEWRFIDILHHWYDGQFSLADIWSTNTAGSEHRTPGFKLYFLANTLWFGLDVRLGCYIGVLSLGLFALLMFRYFIRVRDGAESRAATAFDYYAFLPVALTMFSFTQSHIYAYDLLAEFAITGSMLFGLLWMQMDLRLRTPQPAWRYLGFALTLVFLLLCFGAGKGPALVLATLLLAILLALQAQGGWRSGLKVFGWIGAGALVAELIYWAGGSGNLTGTGLRGLVASALSDLGGVLNYVLHALGAAFITVDTLNDMPVEARDRILDQRGALVLIAALVALVTYIRLRIYRRSLVPVALAVFAAAYIGELVIGRFGGGIENGGAPRYIYTDHLLIVAVVFIFADATRTLYARGRRRAGTVLLSALVIGMGYVEVHNLRVEENLLKYQVPAQQDAITIAKARLAGQARPYPRWYCPSEKLCDTEARFLAEHRLSLFHDLQPAADGKDR